MKYIIFGAGMYGEQAGLLLPADSIDFFIDNDIKKQGQQFLEFHVVSLENALARIGDSQIIIAISDKYVNEIKKQLQKVGIVNYKTISELKYEITREKILRREDYISTYHNAVAWIKDNSIDNEGIINNSNLKKPYPEVTGYYIPTLIRWGYKELAISYAKWLCSIQKQDGSWYDTNDIAPYIFDSAQILKGLLAVREIYPEQAQIDQAITRGCDWIVGYMTKEGRLMATSKDAWGDGKTYSELIHMYCISPIKETGMILNRDDYMEKAEKISKYYITECRNQILNFDLLSHFYAYVMEALLDIGETELAKEAMNHIALIQKESGAVPAYKNVDWVCSTGLFQLSLVWFRLGEVERGNKAFAYACKLQNETGGWFGSYLSEDNDNEVNTYFPASEISWANKYFLDALYFKNLSQFENQAPIFSENIQESDGRYCVVKDAVAHMMKLDNRPLQVLDVGCGKGRYLKNLIEELPDNNYFATDMSMNVMKYFDLSNVEKKQGTLTNIPFKDHMFDFVYACEALEHAVDIESAIKEMARVTKPGGQIVIVDKNKDKLGYYDIEEWEQWFDEKELTNIMLKNCSKVSVNKEINYDQESSNGLFYAWVGTVEKG